MSAKRRLGAARPAPPRSLAGSLGAIPHSPQGRKPRPPTVAKPRPPLVAKAAVTKPLPPSAAKPAVVLPPRPATRTAPAQRLAVPSASGRQTVAGRLKPILPRRA